MNYQNSNHWSPIVALASALIIMSTLYIETCDYWRNNQTTGLVFLLHKGTARCKHMLTHTQREEREEERPVFTTSCVEHVRQNTMEIKCNKIKHKRRVNADPLDSYKPSMRDNGSVLNPLGEEKVKK